jgi:hypothetical protein
MKLNWRNELKSLLRVSVIGFFAINLLFLSLPGPRDRPVEVVVSVFDAVTSRPVSNAVASWQTAENATGDLDCPRIVKLLSGQAKMGSYNAGVLSPGQGHGWQFAAIAQQIGCPEEGLPDNVIGMTTKNGRMEFRAYFPFQYKWVWPCVGHLRADGRLLQIDAVGYSTKCIELRREDFCLVDGVYKLNKAALLDRDAI